MAGSVEHDQLRWGHHAQGVLGRCLVIVGLGRVDGVLVDVAAEIDAEPGQFLSESPSTVQRLWVELVPAAWERLEEPLDRRQPARSAVRPW